LEVLQLQPIVEEQLPHEGMQRKPKASLVKGGQHHDLSIARRRSTATLFQMPTRDQLGRKEPLSLQVLKALSGGRAQGNDIHGGEKEGHRKEVNARNT
jgi:hypothetical protein